MKFTVFSIQEIFLKWIVIISVSSVSTASILYYFQLVDKGDTFIISILYALFLFVLALYVTSISNNIHNSFSRRKDEYINLKKISPFFSKVNTLTEYDDIKKFIISNKALSGRLDNMKEEMDKQKMTPYITEDGFNFSQRYIKVENEFCEQHDEILKDWNKKINEYIVLNKLNNKVNYIHLNNIEKLIDCSWWEEYLDLNPIQVGEIIIFTKSLVKDQYKELKRLKRTKKTIQKMNNSCRQGINKNTKRLEKVYGDKLIYEINEDDNFSYNLKVLERLIKSIDNNMLTDDSIDGIQENIKEIRNTINNADGKVNQLMDLELDRDINNYN